MALMTTSSMLAGPSGIFLPQPPSSRRLVICMSSNPKGPRSTNSPTSTPAEGGDGNTKQVAQSTSSAPSPSPLTGSRSLINLLAFDGAAPETINGRMAMVGLVWAFAAEKMTGLSVGEQLFDPATSGALWFSAVVQLFTLASLIPFSSGENTDGRGWGPFNAKAERWNGRLAMLGFAALLMVEGVRQGPFINL